MKERKPFQTMDRNQKAKLLSAIETLFEGFGVSANENQIDEIVSYSANVLEKGVFDGENPFAKETWNLTRQFELEESDPALADALEKKAKRGSND
jgi:hypothetical protein